MTRFFKALFGSFLIVMALSLVGAGLIALMNMFGPIGVLFVFFFVAFFLIIYFNNEDD